MKNKECYLQQLKYYRVIAFDYFRVGSFKHGVAAINRNNSWGYIDKACVFFGK